MVNKILFWSGFGVAVRFWQMGIEMRPFHHQLWAYGIYGGLGASFGYWLQGVEDKQMRYLRETRDRLLEKRRRRAEREGQPNIGAQLEGSLAPSPQFQVGNRNAADSPPLPAPQAEVGL